MAERRMFAKTIIDSDAFLDMPLSTQALYFHLSMRADDDGFINNPKKIQRMVGAGDDDLKLLLVKRFIIAFESGVVVIKHWKIHNYIQKDRYRPTIYQEEKRLLDEKENKAYTECIQPVSNVDADCTRRIGKGSLEIEGEVEKEKDSIHTLVIAHLNEKAGTKYRASTPKTQALIRARTAEGFTLDDFIAVIDKKCAMWLGSDMEKYLRPETLFGTKFEGYLNEKHTKELKSNGNGGNRSVDQESPAGRVGTWF